MMTKSPCLHWENAQGQAWNNLCMLIALQLEMLLQDPQYPLLLMSNASQIELTFALFQVVEGFQLKLIYTPTKILPPTKASLFFSTPGIFRAQVCISKGRGIHTCLHSWMHNSFRCIFSSIYFIFQGCKSSIQFKLFIIFFKLLFWLFARKIFTDCRSTM